MADELAKLGTLLEDPTARIDLPWCEVSRHIERWAASQWQYVWNSIEGCRQSKMSIGEDACYRHEKELLALSRRECSIVIGWMTGHCHFNRHLRPPSEEFRPHRFCKEENESTEHILWMCPAVEVRRRRYLGSPNRIHYL